MPLSVGVFFTIYFTKIILYSLCVTHYSSLNRIKCAHFNYQGVHSILIPQIPDIHDILLTLWTQNSWLKGQKNITQSLTYNGSCGSCVSEAWNSYHFYICRVGPSEKIMVHDENGINQKDNILVKPFIYVITKPLRNKQKECNICIYNII